MGDWMCPVEAVPSIDSSMLVHNCRGQQAKMRQRTVRAGIALKLGRQTCHLEVHRLVGDTLGLVARLQR